MPKYKISFELQQDDDGYPPFGIESVWALDAETSGQYVLDNIPFFARQATWEDVVEARQTTNGLEFVRVVRASENSLIRVIVYDETQIDAVRSKLIELGCSTEVFLSRQLIAVNVPRTTKLEPVQSYLSNLEEADFATYEEPILRQ